MVKCCWIVGGDECGVMISCTPFTAAYHLSIFITTLIQLTIMLLTASIVLQNLQVIEWPLWPASLSVGSLVWHRVQLVNTAILLGEN